MGSVASFDVIAPREEEAEAAIRRAVQVFRDLDARLSMYRSDSEVAALERAAGADPVSISTDTERVLRSAQEVTDATGGRFDVTIEPLMRRWGFRDVPSAPIERPTDDELRALERRIGASKLEVGDGKARLARSGMAIDVGGIAGGYALDRALAAVRTFDVAAALINFSGDIHCFGQPAEDAPWTVRLVDPQTQQPGSVTLTLHDEALSTSGSYQNRRHSSSGASWGHLLLPSAAEPIAPVGSVTVRHASAQVADAWSTAVYLGADPRDDSLDVTILPS